MPTNPLFSPVSKIELSYYNQVPTSGPVDTAPLLVDGRVFRAEPWEAICQFVGTGYDADKKRKCTFYDKSKYRGCCIYFMDDMYKHIGIAACSCSERRS